MKIPYFLILTACAANVYAEAPRLPPVLDNSTYSDSALVAPPAAAPQPLPNYDETNNLDKLQHDITELKSKVQDQEEAISNLKRANTELEKKLTGGSKSSAPASKKTTSISSSKLPALDVTPPTKTSAKSSPSVETEKEHYQHASDLLKKGDYSQAISEFQALIKKYPSGKYADNSQYWIGVALLNKGDKKGAIQAFDRVARTYPKSEKAPEALFKLGTVLLTINNKSKAKEYFDYVIKNYPGTNGATLAAKKKASEKL